MNQLSNNVILNKEQLLQLRYFIEKKDFRDPSVMLEILDHFACKAEEIWTENPDLSFEQVTQLAHQSFGVMGFRPLENQFTDNLEKRYRKQYKIEIKRIFSSMHILGIVLISVFVAQAFNVISSYPDSYWLQFTFLIILMGVFLSCSIYKILSVKKHGNSLFLQMSNSYLYLEFVNIWFCANFLFHTNSSNFTYILLGISVFINSFVILLGYRMNNYAKNDHEKVKRQMQQLF